jgi:tripartite-type tricarboxylate transporter receptor subunit TctC
MAQHILGDAMTLHRRKFVRLAGAAVALPALPHIAAAEDYPARPVRILVGYAAGGGVDIAGRLIGQWLSERLNGQFVVENRPGASTNIATEAVVRSPPDGYTLLLANAANAINASVFDKLSFDFIRDMTGVGGMMSVAFVLVINPSLPIKSVPELVAYAKANPRKLSVGTGGAGGPDQASSEYFKMETGSEILDVPYRGLGPALTDCLGGQVSMVFATVPSAIEYIKADKLRALAVTTTTRVDVLPNVPTMRDFVPGFDSRQWYGVAAPKGAPADVVAKLNKEIRAGLADPKMTERIAQLGGSPMPMTPGEFDKFIAAETAKWAKVVQFAGIKIK